MNDDQSQFQTDPLDEAERKAVEEFATILDKDKSIRTKVFRELHVKQRESIGALARQTHEIQNARLLAFSPESIDTSTVEAKQKALETIRAEINGLQTEIDLNKSGARKLLANAVWYAKDIGDRLLFVKGELLKHGEYEDWVEENFDGGVSTARAYTRIAKLKNWEKIVPKLHRGTLTIEQALELIKKRPPEKTPDQRRKHLMKMLTGTFSRAIQSASVRKLVRLAHDTGFTGRIQEAAKERKSGREAVQRLRWRLLARQEALDSYVKQPDRNLKLRPMNELV